ncbi:MAG: hypothetical protein U0791_00405 [Gemmataceae bacterium]
MTHSSKRPAATLDDTFPPGSILALLANRSQVDFELDFFSRVLSAEPDFQEVLRIHGENMTEKGRLQDGLAVDKRLVSLRPQDATARYNLACRYALLQQPDLALVTLRTAIELGYRDFRSMEQDRDLDAIRKDPRYRKLLREYQKP